MAAFTVRYWFGDDVAGQTSAYVSERLEAETDDDAERQVRAKMNQALIGVDSDGHGRVILNRTALRFCSILPARSAEEAEAQNRLMAAADPPPEIRQRLTEAAEQVDTDVRRY